MFSQEDVYKTILDMAIEEKEVLAIIIREKIVTLIFSKGDIASRDYFYLYGLFHGLDLKLESRLESYGFLINEHLQSKNFEIMEKILLLEFKTLILILEGNAKRAIREYIESIITFDMQKLYEMRITIFIGNFLRFFPIEIEDLLEAITYNLDKNRYFSLDSIERRSIFRWALHVFWNIPRFYYNKQWKELYPFLKILFAEHFKRNELDEAMYLQFYILFVMANFFKTQEEWKIFNQEIIKIAEPFYKEYAKRLPLCKQKIQTKSKKLIGILKERAVENSPYKVEWSLLKALMQDKKFMQSYDVKIYMMGYAEQAPDDPAIIKSYQEIGIEVVDVTRAILAESIFYHSHLKKALAIREKILKDEVDILVFTNDGYDINDFLITSRCAPIQIFWSHGNFEYDIEEIDKRISHSAKPMGCTYDFESFNVAMDVERFYNPYRDPALIALERAKYPKDTFILGVIGRLMKVDSDEYLETVAKIMKQNLNTIFIAAGVGNQDSIRNKVEKLGISDRFYTPGFVDAHVYGYIIDLWCDTFPLSQGESIVEYINKNNGNFFITMLEETRKERKERVLKYILDYKIQYEQKCKKFNISLEHYKELVFTVGELVLAFNSIEDYIQKSEYIINNIHNKKINHDYKLMTSIYNEVTTLIGKNLAIGFFESPEVKDCFSRI